MPVDRRAIEHLNKVLRATALELHVFAARRHQRQPGANPIQMAGLAHLDLAKAVETLGECGGEFFRHVLDDDDARRVDAQLFEYQLQRLSATGRGTQRDDPVGGGQGTAASRLRRTRLGRNCGGADRRYPRPGRRGLLDLFDQVT